MTVIAPLVLGAMIGSNPASLPATVQMFESIAQIVGAMGNIAVAVDDVTMAVAPLPYDGGYWTYDPNMPVRRVQHRHRHKRPR